LVRLEKSGVFPRPDPLPGRNPSERWYSQADLDTLTRLAEQSGFTEKAYGGKGKLRDLLDTMRDQQPQRPQKPRWNGEEISKRPRQFARRRDEEPEFDWTPPSEKRRIEERQHDPVPPPVCCQKCGQEVVWMMQPVPGAADIQIPVCEKHGEVDLSPPERADPNVCPECGADVVWDLVEGAKSFVPVCGRCGPVEVPQPKVDPRQEQPFQHQVNFNLPPPAPGRSRGLREGDIVAVVRASRPQRGPRLDIMLPHMGPTRPV
jgi:hypothetical protein